MQISKIKIGQTIKVGDLFEEVSSLVPLMGDQVQVFVSAVDELSAIKFVYDAGTDKNWKDGTITITEGFGDITISITDYYFCKTTTLTGLKIADKNDDTENDFTGDYSTNP